MPRRWRAALWSALGALAATRVVLLAHYPSDVVAGWGIGALINKAVGAAFGMAERSASEKHGCGNATATVLNEPFRGSAVELQCRRNQPPR